MAARPFRVVVTSKSFASVEPAPVRELEASGAEVCLVRPRTPLGSEEMAELLAEAHGAIVGADTVTAKVLEAAPHLRIVAMHGVGTDQIDVPAATRQGILVTSAPGSNTLAVAEHTLALMLVLARRVVEAHRRTVGGEWRRIVGLELGGRRLGLVGLGRIGQAVAVRAAAFGMRVQAYDPMLDRSFSQAHGVASVSLEELMGTSDFVSVHVPLTPSTAGMIGADLLARMKSTAYLINTSRGAVLDEPALVEALRTGRLAGAGLDVYLREPPAGSEVLTLPNVVCTPHCGAHTAEAVDRMSRMAATAVLDVMHGRVPEHALNPEAFRGQDHA